MNPNDRRRKNKGRPPVDRPRVRISTMVDADTYADLAEHPRKMGRLIDTWRNIAKEQSK